MTNITDYIRSLQGDNSIYVKFAVIVALIALSKLVLLACHGIFSVFMIIFIGVKKFIIGVFKLIIFGIKCILRILRQALFIIFDTIDCATELPLSLIFKLTGLVKKMILQQDNCVEILCDLFTGFFIGYQLLYTVLYLETFPAVASAIQHSAQLVHRLQLSDVYTHWIMTSHGFVHVVFVVKVVNVFIPADKKFYGVLFKVPKALKYLKYFMKYFMKYFKNLNLPAQDLPSGYELLDLSRMHWRKFKLLDLSRKFSIYIGFLVSSGSVSFGQGTCVMVAAGAACYWLSY